MPKRVPPLTQLQIKAAKSKEKPYKLSDGGGLYVEVMPTGGKLWRMKYRQPDGKENRLSFGSYPDVSVVDARARRDATRQLLAQGKDPGRVRTERVSHQQAIAANTFEKLAREWHRTMLGQWQPQTAHDILHRFELDIFPKFGDLPATEIRTQDVLDAIRAVEQRGAREIARRLTANCARVFRYAMRSGRAERNTAEYLKEVLEPQEKGHFAALGAAGLPALVRAMYANEACMGMPTRTAMRLMLLVFVRTSELIETPWDEIDLERGIWIIPWQRMKRGKRRINPDKTDHHVCLPRQALVLLRQLHSLTGGGTFLFPNMRDPDRPMSNNTLLKALERMGYKGSMTGHGFRALAMGTLKEQLGYRHEVVDRQLAHAPKDKLQSAYDRANYLEERRTMMQHWADYIDQVAAEAMKP